MSFLYLRSGVEIREKAELETIRNDRENLPEELRDDLSGGF